MTAILVGTKVSASHGYDIIHFYMYPIYNAKSKEFERLNTLVVYKDTGQFLSIAVNHFHYTH